MIVAYAYKKLTDASERLFGYKVTGYRIDNRVKLGYRKKLYIWENEKQWIMKTAEIKKAINHNEINILNLQIDKQGRLIKKPVTKSDICNLKEVNSLVYVMCVIEYANKNQAEAIKAIRNSKRVLGKQDIIDMEQLVRTGSIEEFWGLDSIIRDAYCEIIGEGLVGAKDYER